MAVTRIVKVDPLNPKEEILREAARVLTIGGLVIVPTETVYGIAASALDKRAIERLCQVKKRPQEKLFSLHIAEKIIIEDFARSIPPVAYKLMEKFWPGPLTLIFKSKNKGTIGIRLPDNEICRLIIVLAGTPIVCPSANISGTPAPKDFSEAIKDLQGEVDFAIDAGPAKLGIESTVVDLTVEPPKILREGAIKKEDIEEAANKKTVLFVCTGNSCRSVMARALLEKILKEKSRDDVEVLSAGIMMQGGMGATEATRQVLEREGLDVSAHLSQRVTREMIKKSDIILVMEKLQEDRILELVPESKNRLFLLKEFAKIGDDTLDIPDPIGKPIAFYEETFALIKAAVERISNII